MTGDTTARGGASVDDGFTSAADGLPEKMVRAKVCRALVLLRDCLPHYLSERRRPAAFNAYAYLAEVMPDDTTLVKRLVPALRAELHLVREEASGFEGAAPYAPHVQMALCVQRCLEALLSPYPADAAGLASCALGLAADLNQRAPGR